MEKHLPASNLIAAVLLLLAVSTIQAHARFIESTPAPDSVLSEPPTTVTIVFSELLEPDGNKIEVFGTDGTRVDLGDLARLPTDHKSLRVSLPPDLKSDVYRVSWQNMSAEDGHGARGEFSFTYAGTAIEGAGYAGQSPEPGT